MNRMAAPNAGGEYYKSIPDFLQHNFPEWDDKRIYCSIWGFKENQKVSFEIIFLIPEMKNLLLFCLISDLYFFCWDTNMQHEYIYTLHKKTYCRYTSSWGKRGEWRRDYSPIFWGIYQKYLGIFENTSLGLVNLTL